VVAALVVAAFQVWAVSHQAITSDEAYHTLAGYQADRYGVNVLNLEHPPLLKMVAALPFLWRSPDLAPSTRVTDALRGMQAVFTQPGAEARVRLGDRALASALFGFPFLFVVFALGRQVGGTRVGVVLASIVGLDFSVFPLLGLIYTDTLVALAGGLTLLAAAQFARRPAIAPTLVLGLAFGFAIAAKFTGLLLLPAIGLALWFAPLSWRRRALCAAAVLVVGWGIVEVTYAAADRHPDPRGDQDTLHAYFTNHATIVVDDRLKPQESAVLALDRADPRAAKWLTGLLATQAQNSIGVYPMCNFGHIRSHGVWWYFPLLIAAKTPIVLLAASLAGLTAWILARVRRVRRVRKVGPEGTPQQAPLPVLLAVTAAVFLLVAMPSNYNAGLRHLLPILPILYLPAAIWLGRRPRVAGLVILALAVESMALGPIWLSSTATWWLGAHDPLRFNLSLDNVYYPQNLIALRDEARGRGISRLHVVDPSISAQQIDAYLGSGTALTPPTTLAKGAEGCYAVGVAGEVALPAILAADPAELHSYKPYLALANGWLPLIGEVRQGAADAGYLGGTFHLYCAPPGNRR
jgi:hypothetical protein